MTDLTKPNYIQEYYDQMVSGDIIVGKWIMLFYTLVIDNLAAGKYFLDLDKANHAVDWIESHCFHTEGELAPGPFLLELWQKAFVSCIFGIVDENGRRIFREVILIVSRKNGKSLLAAAIAKYVWYVDGGYGTRIYCLAPKLDQADIIYTNVWVMTQLDPEWQEMKERIANSGDGHTVKKDDIPEFAKKRMTDLYIPATNSTVKKIAFSAKKSDGFNPSLTICDEIASWEGDKGLKQYEVMKSGMGARPEGLMLSCSTSGYVNDSIYDELLKRATRFLLGKSKEKRLAPFLYIIDDVEKWNDIDELAKSNPNLGVSVTRDYLQEEIAIAEGSLSKKAEFIVKYCNIKQNSSLAWLSAQTVKKCIGDHLEPEMFRGSYCVGGIDLSQTTDLTAALVVIEKDGVLNVIAKFWLPAEKIDEATERDGVPYRIFEQQGLIALSGENFVDYNDCYEWFRMLVEQYEIYPLQVGYDRYSAQYLVQDMRQYGFHMDDVYQGDNLWGVMQEAEGIMKDGLLNIGDNNLLKMHFLDSAVKMNTERGRGRLIKVSPNVHIDGMAALLDALTVRQKWHSQIGEQLRNEG